MDYDALRAEAVAALQAGDPQGAFTALSPALAYPGELGGPERWADAMEILARVADELGPAELPPLARAVAANPDDPKALYDLGWQLIEMGLNPVAATVLTRANDRDFGNEAILTELVAALERDGLHEEACRVLREATELLESSFLCRYLLAFNALMNGDLDGASALLPRLRELSTGDERHDYMLKNVERMVSRGEGVRGATPLDALDLRGWHYALTGGILLHLSPHGVESMRGRYAFVQDFEAECLQGIRRVEAVLKACDAFPARVLFIDDRDSRILATAAAKVLGLPLEPLDEGPGLVVCYDLGAFEQRAIEEKGATLDLFEKLRQHRPGQVLWSHASAWTRDLIASADLVGFLYQFNTPPWGARLRIDPESNEPVEEAASEAPVEELAQKIVDATLEPDALSDLPALVALATAAAANGAFARDGARPRQWSGGPVKSSRFLG